MTLNSYLRKTAFMKPVSVTKRKDSFSYFYSVFGFLSSSDSGHHPAASGRVYNISYKQLYNYSEDFPLDKKGEQTLTSSAATAATTGTATELPNCLYACVSETGILKVSLKPINREHSLGVRRRGFESGTFIRISEPSL